MRGVYGLLLAVALLLGAACSSSSHSPTASTAAITAASPGEADSAQDPASGAIAPAAIAAARATLPPGSEGRLIAQGRDIIVHTQSRMPGFVRAGMSCEACHVGAGTRPHGGSFVGIYAKFPQWNQRSRRYIALQDRLAECFLYSMNGKPPAYASHEMVALVAYIAFLSRGAPVGAGFQGLGFEEFRPARTPSIARGSHIYAQRCLACHGAEGQGLGGRPPLWGPKSFNGGAGMHRLNTMAGFVRYNMPYGSPPDTLSQQDAYDVSAFVLSHPRPAFDPHAVISFPALPAKYF